MTLTELQDRGVAIEPHEAVAIAQQLIHSDPAAAEPFQAPVGPPAPDNVIVQADGTVASGCHTTPAVSEMAILLQSICERAGAAVPGGLRYTVARALLEVHAPPFDSIEEFSEALERFEQGDRQAVVRRLVARADPFAPAALAESDRARIAAAHRAFVERRRPGVTAFDMRRELREADRRAFERSTPAAAGRRSTGGRAWLTAALVVVSASAGGTVVQVAQHRGVPWQSTTAPPAFVAAPPPAAVPEPVSHERIVSPEPEEPATGGDERDAVPAAVGTDGQSAVAPVARVVIRSKPHARRVQRARTTSARQDSGLVQALKFKWLRNVFVQKR